MAGLKKLAIVAYSDNMFSKKVGNSFAMTVNPVIQENISKKHLTIIDVEEIIKYSITNN